MCLGEHSWFGRREILAFNGPGDMATALSVPGQYDHPKVQAAVAEAEAEAEIMRSKIPLGGVARTPYQAKKMIDRGYRALVLASIGCYYRARR